MIFNQVLYYPQTNKGVITINANIPFILFYELEKDDLNNIVNLSNNLIMFDRQLKEIEDKYFLDLRNMSYCEVVEFIEVLDQKLFELIESKSA